ncbi:Clavaminate synthase-like protein [Lentinus tigrinus ALCF2SS1-7]|uniref:Clavaminate synthase-like protein n=1 Tax=Lentinus tigrinus ALCF2SS1-6 TaxID=1328759 RepID=A0A5C2S4P4_9APHY|nr:Clavaminate synthase-like protein [Lentinus tigrinus ALCF2SS1-6]RPD72718.1 Clavaminate synthase-like protein [Lentinus tigrinus ALCF2SS1-7]
MPKKLKLERIDPSTSAEEFFSNFVSKRKPVVLRGLLNDNAFKGRQWTDLTYLATKAGDVEVLVEPIHPTANQYGTDVDRVPMPFRDFLKSLRDDKGPHPYLTTQYSDEDPDAETVFPPPTNALKDEFPTVPRIMGNLFLQQVNLWLGKSKEGSSSGLHHDFHDNLYCLLQGKKRFVLFPPSEIQNLYPYGSLDTVHPNGLISYEDCPVRADGLSKRAACKARIGALERQIDALKATSKGKSKGHSKEMKKLINAHDEALDELAMLALDDQGGEDEVDDFDALMGDLDDVEAELSAGPSESAADEDGDDEEAEEWFGIGTSKSDNEDEDDEDAESDEGDSEDEDPGDALSEEKSSEPSSFSRIPTAHLHQFLDLPTTASLPPDFSPSDFPGLRKATAPYVVELSAGEMLYLPASWWHEVTSTSPDDAKEGDVHMAFNYWFYPPDALDNFEKPYEDSLVWGHLRSKGRPERRDAPAERVKVGKRGRDKGDSEGLKKAKR